jgi:very-short-patch-repair endonuclease
MNDVERWHRDTVPAARRLRRETTASEELVWERLRGRQFYGLKFRRQHPVGPFVLDFCRQEMMFAIEVDGGIHLDPGVAARDREREAILLDRHIQFFRWATEHVELELDALLYRLAIDLELERPALSPLLPGRDSWEKGLGDEGDASFPARGARGHAPRPRRLALGGADARR